MKYSDESQHSGAVVLEISSDEDADWNDDRRGVSVAGDDRYSLVKLPDEVNKEVHGDDSDEVVVVSEFGKPVKKLKLKALDDDCVMYDEDPNAHREVRNDDSGDGDDDSDDVIVVSEKGQVACRDYPHSRHLCIKFPFSTTPNQSHCNQCYCYVCDSLAPCVYWGNGSASADHCHATDKDEFWKLERKNAKNGSKAIQPVSQLPVVNLYTPAAATVQPQIQIPNPGLIPAHLTSANVRSPNIINQYRNNILASSNKLHQYLVSQLAHKYAVKAATTANRNSYRSYMGNDGNPIGLQDHQVNGMLSGSSKYLGSLQPNAPNTSVSHHPESQTYTSSTVNQPQPQYSNHSNPNFQSHVNSNPIPENSLDQQLSVVPPSSSRTQSASSQQTYVLPAQPSYPVPSKTQVDNLLAPILDFTHNTSQGNQSQGPITTMDSGFKDCGLGLHTGQDSATLEGAGPTNESSLAAVSGCLADYQFDWIFDNQPIEPGLADYSFDSAFIDTGLIFDF